MTSAQSGEGVKSTPNLWINSKWILRTEGVKESQNCVDVIYWTPLHTLPARVCLPTSDTSRTLPHPPSLPKHLCVRAKPHHKFWWRVGPPTVAFGVSEQSVAAFTESLKKAFPKGRLLKMRILVLVPLLISGMPNEKWDVSFTKSDFSLLKSHISLLYSHFSLMKSHIPLPTSSFSNITTDLEWKWQYVSPFLISHFLYPTFNLEWEMWNVKWDLGKSQNLTF